MARQRRMEEHLPETFGLPATLRKVGVVYDDAAGGLLCVRPAADFSDELPVDGVEEASPVHPSVIHQAVEHVLLAAEQLAEPALRILHREEREQHKQFHHLYEGELAVRILDRADRLALYGEAVHQGCYGLDCAAGAVVSGVQRLFLFMAKAGYLFDFVSTR